MQKKDETFKGRMPQTGTLSSEQHSDSLPRHSEASAGTHATQHRSLALAEVALSPTDIANVKPSNQYVTYVCVHDGKELQPPVSYSMMRHRGLKVTHELDYNLQFESLAGQFLRSSR